MQKFTTVAFFISFLIPLCAAAQEKPRSRSGAPAAMPGVTTVTSFDTDHTVIGVLEIVPFTSKIFHNTRMLRVWLPANYASPRNAQRSYPVMYMHDAQNLFDETTAKAGEWHVDETAEHLVGSFKIPPMMVVGIDNAGDKRASEYLPYSDPNARHLGAPDEAELHGKDYATFLLTEVMPFIEKRYRVARGPMNTGIGGSSYGGVISLYTVLQHPGIFGHALIESPPLGVGEGQLLKDAENAKQLPQKMYLAIGTSESKNAEYNTKLVKDMEELQTILRKKGVGPDRLRVVVDEGAAHNEAAWSRRLPDAMLFLYGH